MRSSSLAKMTALAGSAFVAACAAGPLTPSVPPITGAAAPPSLTAGMGTPSATLVFMPDMKGGTERANGRGTLSFNGKTYAFTADGVTTGTMGTAPGPVSGEIYHLNAIGDLKGMFTAKMSADSHEAILENANGVTIHLTSTSGLAMNGDPYDPGKMTPGQLFVAPVGGGV
jgi:hypothetical protein